VKFIIVVVFKVCSVRIRHVSSSFFFFFFFFFVDMSAQEGRVKRRIRTSDLHFIR
jgi:hypothetical protein